MSFTQIVDDSLEYLKARVIDSTVLSVQDKITILAEIEESVRIAREEFENKQSS